MGEEMLGGGLVLGQDRVGMLRAVAPDMAHRPLHALHDPGRDHGVQIFRVPVLLAGGQSAPVGGADVRVAAHFAAGRDQVV